VVEGVWAVALVPAKSGTITAKKIPNRVSRAGVERVTAFCAIDE
jgi:hypothetical protein